MPGNSQHFFAGDCCKYLELYNRRVEIFNDKDYIKKIKEAKRLGVQRSARPIRTPTQRSTREEDRPRSLVMQKVVCPSLPSFCY